MLHFGFTNYYTKHEIMDAGSVLKNQVLSLISWNTNNINTSNSKNKKVESLYLNIDCNTIGSIAHIDGCLDFLGLLGFNHNISFNAQKNINNNNNNTNNDSSEPLLSIFDNNNNNNNSDDCIAVVKEEIILSQRGINNRIASVNVLKDSLRAIDTLLNHLQNDNNDNNDNSNWLVEYLDKSNKTSNYMSGSNIDINIPIETICEKIVCNICGTIEQDKRFIFGCCNHKNNHNNDNDNDHILEEKIQDEKKDDKNDKNDNNYKQEKTTIEPMANERVAVYFLRYLQLEVKQMMAHIDDIMNSIDIKNNKNNNNNNNDDSKECCYNNTCFHFHSVLLELIKKYFNNGVFEFFQFLGFKLYYFGTIGNDLDCLLNGLDNKETAKKCSILIYLSENIAIGFDIKQDVVNKNNNDNHITQQIHKRFESAIDIIDEYIMDLNYFDFKTFISKFDKRKQQRNIQSMTELLHCIVNGIKIQYPNSKYNKKIIIKVLKYLKAILVIRLDVLPNVIISSNNDNNSSTNGNNRIRVEWFKYDYVIDFLSVLGYKVIVNREKNCQTVSLESIYVNESTWIIYRIVRAVRLINKILALYVWNLENEMEMETMDYTDENYILNNNHNKNVNQKVRLFVCFSLFWCSFFLLFSLLYFLMFILGF